jgi:hypothetical protein
MGKAMAICLNPILRMLILLPMARGPIRDAIGAYHRRPRHRTDS